MRRWRIVVDGICPCCRESFGELRVDVCSEEWEHGEAEGIWCCGIGILQLLEALGDPAPQAQLETVLSLIGERSRYCELTPGQELLLD